MDEPNATFRRFWVKVEIKGSLAVVIGIVFLRWIHPSGAANVPTWVWLFGEVKAIKSLWFSRPPERDSGEFELSSGPR
jgi:hypothetical protein